jgi:RsiW-degrading membrane proteinase PrsW (M82 family)
MVASGLIVLGSETSSTGLPAFVVGVALALLPLPVVLAAFRWVDRYEPEPKGLLAFAFFWGATVAALISGLLNTISAMVAAGTAGTQEGVAATAVLVAPWVEEAAKGAAILAVFLFRRKEFDGVVDGIVLAGFVGVGFAFTENILYFGRAFLAGNEELGVTGGLFAAGVTFVLRGVLAPFAHPLFTVMTGIGLGIAARTGRAPVRLLAPLTGYLLAVLLHATWNYSSLGGLQGFLTGYVLIFVPAFAFAIAVATWSRRREGATVATWLPVYVQAGWLADGDVAMLASMPRRRQALAWAERTYGAGSARALRDFQHTATELAFLRDRAERGLGIDDFATRERDLLADLARTRQAVSRPAHA